MSRSSQFLAAVVYLVVVALVIFGMWRARDWATSSMSGAIAQGDWQTYRDDVVTMNESGSVRRRVPKSIEPPALVLMRDYFHVCTAISVVLTTALYITLVFFIAGASRPPQDEDAIVE